MKRLRSCRGRCGALARALPALARLAVVLLLPPGVGAGLSLGVGTAVAQAQAQAQAETQAQTADSPAPAVPRVPARFVADVPAACGQLLLVLSTAERASSGTLWQLERRLPAAASAPAAPAAASQPGTAAVPGSEPGLGPGAGAGDEGWQIVGAPIPVNLGRNGLAWGVGEHRAAPPPGWRVKQEGDGCSPAGVFRLPFAFGQARGWPGLGVPYVPATPTLFGVDDPQSRHYNQVVDARLVRPDWRSAEAMLRPQDALYRWGIAVAHNPANVPGAGSCIFLHIWEGPSKPTSGCTTMAEADLVRVLRWLDARKEPRLVQAVAGW